MDYCKHYFGKSLRELGYQDIVEFFTEVREENETLEFKSGGGEFDAMLTKNIIRGISALLNSTGGVLVWGTPQERNGEKGKGKICQGVLVPVQTFKEKDWLINRITREISYMPIGVNVERLGEGDNYIYVFEVKESMSKPHQYNGAYHIRLDGQSKPAPHYLVDALIKQVKFPELSAKVEFERQNHISGQHAVIIKVSISNNSNFLNAKDVSYFICSNSGTFRVSNSNRETVEYKRILPKGLELPNTHTLLIANHSIIEGIIVDVQFFSENSPLKIKTYQVSMDSMYETLKVEPIIENMDIHEAMEMIDKNKSEK